MRYIFRWLEHSIFFFCPSDLEKISRALVAFCPIFYPAAQRLFFSGASRPIFSTVAALPFFVAVAPQTDHSFLRFVCSRRFAPRSFPIRSPDLVLRHDLVCVVWRTRVTSTLDLSSAASDFSPIAAWRFFP